MFITSGNWRGKHNSLSRGAEPGDAEGGQDCRQGSCSSVSDASRQRARGQVVRNRQLLGTGTCDRNGLTACWCRTRCPDWSVGRGPCEVDVGRDGVGVLVSCAEQRGW